MDLVKIKDGVCCTLIALKRKLSVFLELCYVAKEWSHDT